MKAVLDLLLAPWCRLQEWLLVRRLARSLRDLKERGEVIPIARHRVLRRVTRHG